MFIPVVRGIEQVAKIDKSNNVTRSGIEYTSEKRISMF